MAWIDKQAIFSPFSSYGGTPDSLAISTATASSIVYDITGAGSGNAPPQTFGTASTFGSDMGVGDGKFIPFVLLLITTSLAGGTSMNFALQSAPDNGSNAPGAWSTVDETGTIALANLTAGTRLTVAFSRRAPGAAPPRFYRMLYTPTGTFTAGGVSAGIVIGGINDIDIGQIASNISFGAAG